jgi:hypothetical protein
LTASFEPPLQLNQFLTVPRAPRVGTSQVAPQDVLQDRKHKRFLAAIHEMAAAALIVILDREET